LAAMIAEKASEKSFRDLVHALVIEPHGLTSTFYEASTYPESVIKRLAHGYFESEACADYQPQCKESWNLPIVGRDMREASTSWMQSAGGGPKQASRSRRCLPITRKASPSGWPKGFSGLSARNGSTRAKVSAIGRSMSGLPTRI